MQRPSVKALLPHLFYVAILLACVGYFRHSAAVSEQEIHFLNGVTDEVLTSVKRENRRLFREVGSFLNMFNNEWDTKTGSDLRMADSLLSIPVNNSVQRDQLIECLDKLISYRHRDLPKVEQYLTMLPGSNSHPSFGRLYDQRDTLYRQFALFSVMEYYADYTIGNFCGFFNIYDIAMSGNPICPCIGELFQGDIVLSPSQAIQLNKLKINNLDVPVENGIGHFEQTFSVAGAFPVNVRAEYLHFGEGKSLIVEKRFVLNVKK